jgi:hypothetical protein
MSDDLIHSVPESSCFFQGHKDQFFSRKYGKFLSFRIIYNDNEFESDFNSERYRPIFSKLINRKIAQRKQDGGNFHEINPDDIIIKKIKLIDDVDTEGTCGQFVVYPATAICKKDGCNTYFELHNGRKCGHKDTDPWEQFTFLAFCDECGRLLPLHYMTNINNDCKKCGGKNTLLKLKWTRGKDNIGSYKVICTKCHQEYDLFFYKCDHTIRKSGEVLSKVSPKKFRGVPARAGAIVHPYVISIPDLSKNGTNESGRSNSQESLFSESFVYFFGPFKEESKLNLPEFKDALSKDEEFWDLSKIRDIFEDLCDDLDLNIKSHLQLSQNQFTKIIQKTLIDAISRINNGAEESKIKSKYGISFIEQSLNNVKEIEYSENDMQCSNLLFSTDGNKKKEPLCKTPNYPALLNEYGLKKIIHYSDITMIQSLLGIIEGSTRRNPVLFQTIETGKTNHKKPTVYIREFPTEGILFQLNFEKTVQWLYANRIQIGIDKNNFSPANTDPYTYFRSLILNDDNCKKAVDKLLHTYSHMLIQQSTVDTGLDIQSLSEIICPYTCSIFIYSTNSINIGGLEFTYDYHLEDWFNRFKELAQDCPQDPACMFDEGGACNSCSYIPEFVCYNFNQNLDRSTLVGNSERFIKGYLK